MKASDWWDDVPKHPLARTAAGRIRGDAGVDMTETLSSSR